MDKLKALSALREIEEWLLEEEKKKDNTSNACIALDTLSSLYLKIQLIKI